MIVPLSEIPKAPTVRIEAIDSKDLDSQLGAVFHVNACGMVDSKRGKHDGCTIIGTKGENSLEGPPLNDFSIGQEKDGEGRRHTIIKYSLADRRYYIRDLGEGSGTFVKVARPLVLKTGYIISFGDSHMTVNFFEGRSSKAHQRMQLKFIDGPKTD